MTQVKDDGGYFFVVRWDDGSQETPMLSYFGRKTCRLFLERLARGKGKDSLTLTFD